MVFLLMRVSGRVTRHSSAVTSSESQSLVGLLIQAVPSFKYLRATGTFPKFQARLDVATDRLAHAANRSGSAAALSQSVTQPVQVLFLTTILYYRAVHHQELASLFVVLVYLFRIGTELSVLQGAWQSFLAGTASVDAVLEGIAETERQREPRGTTPYPGLQR
jgi:ABC-type bacteriocin/lantibiotic exporter with double-glycine peptidase domain